MSPPKSPKLSTRELSLLRQIAATKPPRSQRCSSRHIPPEFVDIVVDIADKKKLISVLPEDGQGLRSSRGGHVWPRALMVRTLSKTQWTWPASSGRPGSASVFPPTKWDNRAEFSGVTASRRGEVGRPHSATVCLVAADLLREGVSVLRSP
jgi:hypothetical protein